MCCSRSLGVVLALQGRKWVLRDTVRAKRGLGRSSTFLGKHYDCVYYCTEYSINTSIHY
jgi:hypothetical protein